MRTLISLVQDLPSFGKRRAVGLRRQVGLRWWSYGDLHDRAHGVASLLAQRGIGRGDRVLLWAANCPEWVAFLLGAGLRGAAVVPLDENCTEAWARRIVDQTRPVLAVCGPGQNGSALGLPLQKLWTSMDPDAASRADVRVEVMPDDPAVVLFTSGSTRTPKGVVLTHRNLMSQLEPFLAWRWPLRLAGCPILALSPASHVQGLLMGVLLPLSIGLSVIFSDSASPPHILRTIRENRVTLLLAVPRVQDLLARAIRKSAYGKSGLTIEEKLRRLRWFPLRRHCLFLATHRLVGYRFWVLMVGGAPLPPEVERFWFEAGYFLVHGYGLTETAALVSINLNTPFSRRIGSIGRVLSNQEIVVDGKGQLLVRGPNVAQRYFGDRRLLFRKGGFLATGDLVRIVGRRLYYRGRLDETIVTGEGFNVQAHDLETAFARHPNIREAVALGLPREGHQEIHVVLLTDDGQEASAIVDEVNRSLEPHQRAVGWTVWPHRDFPRTGLRKVRREAVRSAIVGAGTSAEEVAIDRGPATLEQIRATGDKHERLRLIADYLVTTPQESLKAELRLREDLGLSSLETAELQWHLERRAGTVLNSAPSLGAATLGSVHALLETPSRQQSESKSVPRMDHPLFSLPRKVLRHLLPLLRSLSTRLTVQGRERLASLPSPVIVAAAGHRHGADVLAITSALPRRFRRKLLFVTTDWFFDDYLNPDSPAPLLDRLRTALSFRLVLPSLLPFGLWNRLGGMDGLSETGRLIDRGYSVLVFPEEGIGSDAIQPGIGLLAAHTQLPIVPLVLSGNEDVGLLPKWPRTPVRVTFGGSIRPSPGMSEERIGKLLLESFRLLKAPTSARKDEVDRPMDEIRSFR